MKYTDREKIMARICVAENGCWLWIGVTDRCGYGRLNIKQGKIVSAHRLSYVTFNGALADGLEIDHLCRNRACVNPEHLEAVSHKENTLRGNNPAAINARRTECRYGHPFITEKTAVGKTRRRCRTCTINRSAEYRLRARARSLEEMRP